MSNIQRKRPKVGDIIQIITPKGLAYFQYTHKHPLYGYLVRILPGLYQECPNNFQVLVQQPERFFTFFPLGAALNRGIVSILASEEVPECIKQFPLMRRRGVIDQSGKVLDWWLWNGKREWKINKLSSKEKKLSIAAIVNDTLLIKRIITGWSPDTESEAI